MNLNQPNFRADQILILFSFAMIITLLSLYYRMGSELIDDGAFFLKYAENMLQGEFWVWNLGEEPVWGASAPFYPLVLSLAMCLGFKAELAITVVGFTLTSVSLSVATLMIGHRLGVLSGIVFLIFCCMDSTLMFYSISGLETPLTLSILTMALWTLLYAPKSWLVGLVAGVLMINKLDLLPIGGLLLLVYWFKVKQFPIRAVLVAFAIAASWYGFAWWYFGLPVPNSFVTKSLHQGNMTQLIDWTWFSVFVLWAGAHKWLAGLSLINVIKTSREDKAIVIFFAGLLLIHITAYSIKHPSEPYHWYTMPAVYSLIILATYGLSRLTGFIAKITGKKTSYALIIPGFLAIFTYMNYAHEVFNTKNNKYWLSHFEYDRAEAGRWVAQNTPGDFIVYTMWGNPAYHSKRNVIDGAFLNRKYEITNPVERYKPEIIIHQAGAALDASSKPSDPKLTFYESLGYELVKTFSKTYYSGNNYFFVVYARKDILNLISNKEPPTRDLMSYIDNVQLGDTYGTLMLTEKYSLFIHPGANSATQFEFDAGQYLSDRSQNQLSISAKIDDDLPRDAKLRGVDVLLKVLISDEILIQEVITSAEPVNLSVKPSEGQVLSFIVENNGSSDNDRLILSIE